MRGLSVVLIFVLGINVLFFFGQTAVASINPGGASIFNYQGSLIASYDTGNYTLPTDPSTQLPNQAGSISPTTGNIFTDAWSALTNWFLSVTGGKYLIAFINTVPNFLKALGLPAEFAFAAGWLWYLFSLFIIVAYIRGMDL